MVKNNKGFKITKCAICGKVISQRRIKSVRYPAGALTCSQKCEKKRWGQIDVSMAGIFQANLKAIMDKYINKKEISFMKNKGFEITDMEN